MSEQDEQLEQQIKERTRELVEQAKAKYGKLPNFRLFMQVEKYRAYQQARREIALESTNPEIQGKI